MSRTTLAVIGGLMLLTFALGALLGSHPAAALAQGGDTGPNVTALLKPLPVVAAVPFQSHTEYEQDPFDQTKLRRTQTTLTRVVLVRSDGSTEIKNVQ